MDKSRRVWQANIEEKIIQFLSVEFILTYIRNPQYHSENFPPNIYWRESQGDTQLSVLVLVGRYIFWSVFRALKNLAGIL
jgi:hypothetical protein